MKIHLNQIPLDGVHVEGEEDGSILELNDALMRPIGPVQYALDIGLSEDGLFATGLLSVHLEMECVRCLNLFKYPLRLDSFAMQMELGGTEMIDLTPHLREDILLALPAHPHCDWNGENECPGALINLDAKAISHLSEPEIVSEALNAWEALDQLQIKTKE